MDDEPQITWAETAGVLRRNAAAVDQSPAWPRENMEALRRAGAMAWGVMQGRGGAGIDPGTFQERVLDVAAECLTTALAWTQRDAAVGFLRGVDRTALVGRLLDELSAGTTWATIGIAQLTTSRQYGAAAVRARRADGGWIFDGDVPWATGADVADWLVVGAVEAKGQQVLAAVHRASAGVTMEAPMEMAALRGSRTAAVLLRDVFIPDENMLCGPTADALAGRKEERSFALPTCVLPLGVARGAIVDAEGAAGNDAIFVPLVGRLRQRYEELKAIVFSIGLDPPREVVAAQGAELRGACNRLALDASAAALQLAKGRGLMVDHPAQRRMREAMFFMAWSSPRGVVEASLRELVGPKS
jgi:butyryl-CoA dehydrogenase